jgi:hypothetical protein
VTVPRSTRGGVVPLWCQFAPLRRRRGRRTRARRPYRGAPIAPEHLIPFRTVDVPDGLGVVELAEEDEYAFQLRLGGDPVAADADTRDGSLVWMATRLLHSRGLAEHHRLDSWVEPPAWDRLRQWLRHVEPGDDAVGHLEPLLDLLAPGAYAIGVQALPKPFVVATRQREATHWYAGMEWKDDVSAIVPTHHWSPRKSTVDEYRNAILYERRRPASIMVTHPDSEVYYLLDGHHKLAAYMEAGRDPVAVVIELGTGQRPEYLAYLDRPSTAYTVEENESGTGVLAVYGRDGASALRIGGRPGLVEGYVGRGTVDRLAVRTGDPRFRRKARRLRDWLREPDPASGAAMTRTVWRFLAPGRYGIRRWVSERHVVMAAGEQRLQSWYLGIATPDAGTALVLTDQWPGADDATVRDYRRRIEQGQRPLVLTLRASPPEEDEEDSVAFVIDGHHKLRAYELAGVAPHCLDIAKMSDERACSPEDLDKVVGGEPGIQDYTSGLMEYLRSPR